MRQFQDPKGENNKEWTAREQLLSVTTTVDHPASLTSSQGCMGKIETDRTSFFFSIDLA